MTKVLVYRGWGDNGLGVFGHVIGTNFTYEITGHDPDYTGYSNLLSQAGDGFVFRGTNTNGYDDGLAYSNGSGYSVLLNDENGNIIDEPTGFSQFGDQSVFLAATASVSATYPPRSLMITDGDGAPKVMLPEPVSFYTYAAGDLWARTYSGDLYRIKENGSFSLIYDDSLGGNDLDIDYMFEFKGELFIRGSESLDNDFYKVDPDNNTITELNIGENGGGDSIYFWYGGVAENQFFFWWHGTSGTGNELYVSDGTYGGTHLVKDINPGSSGSYVAHETNPNTVGDLLFFVANDGVNGQELWVSDGTEVGTFALSGASTNVGALGFNSMSSVALGNELLFTAYSAAGEELYITDGTIAGTRLLADINPNLPPYADSSSPTFWVTSDGLAYFSILSGPDNEAIWVTDGTAAGTYVVSDPDSGNGSNDATLANIVDLQIANIPVYETAGTTENDVIEGSFLRDLLRGEEGKDTLSGLGADDALEGGVGNDILDGGAGSDTALYENASGGVQVYLNANKTRGADGYDRLYNIENVTGSDFDDRLVGNVSDNVLSGGAGNDLIKGKGGSDIFNGGDGDDILIGGNGDDAMFGDAGNDILFALAGLDTLNGGADDDFLYGGQDADILNGDGGIDKLKGNRGEDTLNGGEGDDDLRGGAQNDILNGGDGVDYLFGENHEDTLNGGAGNDVLTGGAGGGVFDGLTDTFVYVDTAGGGGGFDRVKDFENGIDLIDLQSFGLGNFAAVQALASDSGSGLRINFGSGDVLYVENFSLADFDVSDVLI